MLGPLFWFQDLPDVKVDAPELGLLAILFLAFERGLSFTKWLVQRTRGEVPGQQVMNETLEEFRDQGKAQTRLLENMDRRLEWLERERNRDRGCPFNDAERRAALVEDLRREEPRRPAR